MWAESAESRRHQPQRFYEHNVAEESFLCKVANCMTKILANFNSHIVIFVFNMIIFMKLIIDKKHEKVRKTFLT